MKTTQPINKPFGKPFWKLLSVSVLGLCLIYGGLIYAGTKGDACTEYSKASNTKSGGALADISDGWSPVRKICESIVKNTASQVAVKTTNINNKTIQLTNNSSVDYFVPVRTDKELNAFLARKDRFQRVTIIINFTYYYGTRCKRALAIL